MDPRDVTPLAHRAMLRQNGQGRPLNADRRKYCQLSSADDGPVYHTKGPRSASEVDNTFATVDAEVPRDASVS